jgi:hypothetical protein
MENKAKKNIYDKVMEARLRLQEKNLKKSGKNEYSGFSYYELSDFMPDTIKIFQDLKLYSMFSINQEKVATLVIINGENPSESVTYQSPVVDVQIKGCTSIQGLGAAHTYMKRYLYMNALEIVENDQLDANAGKITSSKIDEIESIKSLDDLNEVYGCLSKMKYTETGWKTQLKSKADAMHARFNTDLQKFELAMDKKPLGAIANGVPNGYAPILKLAEKCLVGPNR